MTLRRTPLVAATTVVAAVLAAQSGAGVAAPRPSATVAPSPNASNLNARLRKELRVATPAPHRAPARLPTTPLHSEFDVDVNAKGQVSRVRIAKASPNPGFNLETYGNASQAFIRTVDNHVVVGTYRLTYDYNPKTAKIRRDVALLRRGGVNPNAEGVVTRIVREANLRAAALQRQRQQQQRHPSPKATSR